MAHDQLQRAIAVATRAYDGRVDRQGEPYVAHAIRVMLALETDDERAVAMLHDVFEWGAITRAEFAGAGFPGHVVAAVDALTKRDDETLAEHVERMRASTLATSVKIADLRDNALPWRLDALPDEQRATLVAMYRETATLMGLDLDALCGREVG